jgi:hypothetical protein
MSAPPETPSADPVPAQTPTALPSVNGRATGHITPTGAGVAGAALGFGAGLVVAELVVPGLVLGAVAIVGLAATRRLSRLIRRGRSAVNSVLP